MKLSPKIIAIVPLVSCLAVLVINVIGYLALKIWWVNSIEEYIVSVFMGTLVVYVSTFTSNSKNIKRKEGENDEKSV
ncbi:hypothetical protein HMPREF9278_1873 [Mobiluncus mulieris FB024-16]|nr:hypothetical protein HMPREF9278_1873 [Mobiluncus mulieris FB024-16]